MRRRLSSLIVAWAVAIVVAPRATSAQVIPVKPGVVLTYATQPVDSTQRFDFERLIQVDSVNPQEWHLTDRATNQLKPSNKTVKIATTTNAMTPSLTMS